MNILSVIVKSYFSILISIGSASFFIFLTGLFFIMRSSLTSTSKQAALAAISPDLTAIAGEDILATQLDLARAYLEADRSSQAKSILKLVAKQGDPAQREEAKRLLSRL